MKTSRISLTALCGALAGLSALPLFGQAPDTQAPVPAAQSPDARVPRLSAGLDDIVKLTKARVDDSVILSYVQASQVSYHPSAQEIIRLREAGVSPPVITAVVQRGAEVRQQVAETAKAVKRAAPAAPAKVQPPEPTPVAPAASSPTVFVAPSSYEAAPSTVIYTGSPTYSYPGWYGYGGYYPGFYGSYGYSCYPRYSGWYSYGSCYPRYGGSFGVYVGGGYRGGGYHGGGYYGGGHYGGSHFSGGYRGGGVHAAGFRGGFHR